MSQDLLNYIKTLRDQKISDSEIKSTLLGAGWGAVQVDEALSGKKSVLPPPPPPPSSLQGNPSGATFWDAFEHILMFISLYFMAIGASLVLHYLVDLKFPDPTEVSSYGFNDFYDFVILCAQASIIVATPLFAFFHLDITRRTKKNPALRRLKARRTLIYITLIITFLIMIGNLIGTVYNFLTGNVTLNFLLNLLVTFFIAGTIFAHYLLLVKEDQKAYA